MVYHNTILNALARDAFKKEVIQKDLPTDVKGCNSEEHD